METRNCIDIIRYGEGLQTCNYLIISQLIFHMGIGARILGFTCFQLRTVVSHFMLNCEETKMILLKCFMTRWSFKPIIVCHCYSPSSCCDHNLIDSMEFAGLVLALGKQLIALTLGEDLFLFIKALCNYITNLYGSVECVCIGTKVKY